MDQRKRMFFVLTCLTGAMTSTASLLAWMAPSSSATATIQQSKNILGIARSLVSEDVPVQSSQWHRVEIVPEPSAASADLLLASSQNLGEYHFFIDDRGSLSRASSWRGQIPASNDPDAVRVRLARSSSAEPISSQQGQALSALLRALTEAVSPTQDSLPVRLDPAFAPAPLRAASTLTGPATFARISG